MRSRLFRPAVAALILVTGALIVTAPPLLTRAQDPKPAAKANPSADLIRRTVTLANEGKYPEAVALAEEAARLDPKAGRLAALVASLANLGADNATVPADRLAFLRQSAAARARLKGLDGPVDRNLVERLDARAPIDGARILALEGKPGPALDAVLKLVAGGFDDPDALDDQPDFGAVRALPGYRARLDEALRAGVRAAIAATKPFPFDFDLKDSDGHAVKAADLRGHVAIVDIWGTWCPPCRQEVPHFVDLAARYQDKGLKIVGINCNEEGSPAEVRKTINAYKAEQKMNYPCLLNDDATEGKVPGFQGYPTTLFLDRAGKVRLVLVGYVPLDRLETAVTTLLAEPAPR